jgi:hypothetical protein
MKRTNKHIKETPKPAQQPAFKTPAQELEQFKAKVLAIRYGETIWLELNAYPFEEWGRKISATGYELYIATFGLATWGKISATVNEEFSAALGEVQRKADELWPQFARLLRRVPDELKAYQKRYNRNRRQPKHVVFRDARDLRQEPGRPRKLATRDAQIAYLRDVQGCSFGQIARMLKIYDKHGAPSGAKACSAYRRYGAETETKLPLNSDTET